MDPLTVWLLVSEAHFSGVGCAKFENAEKERRVILIADYQIKFCFADFTFLLTEKRKVFANLQLT